MDELGSRIASDRVAAGLTVAEVAAKVGRTRQWLHRLEAGKMTRPSRESLRSVALLLRQDPDEYLALAGLASMRPASAPFEEQVTAAVDRAMDRLGDRLEVLLRELLGEGER